MPAPAATRVAIVGAGPGGLAAALLLAKEGVPVTVFEKEPAVGGRTRVMRTPQGYSFDLGPTFFLYPRILADIFAACGERLQDHVELRRLDPQYRLIFEGGGTSRRRRTSRVSKRRSRASPRGREQRPPLSRRQPKEARALPAGFGAGLLEPPRSRLAGHARGAAVAAALHERRPGPAALLRRSARPPRLLVPDEISRHVAVPVPEPVHDPLLSRIRARRLSSDRRLRRGVGGDGAGRAEARRRDPPEHAGRAHPLSTTARRSGSKPAASASPPGQSSSTAISRDAVRRLVPETMRRALARPQARARRSSPARPSCSISALRATSATCRTIRSCCRANTSGTSPRSPTASCPKPSFYVQHAGVTDPRLAPPGHSSLYVLVPVPNLRCGIDWEREAPRYRRLALSG